MKRSLNDRFFFVFLSFFVSFSDHFKNNRFKNFLKNEKKNENVNIPRYEALLIISNVYFFLFSPSACPQFLFLPPFARPFNGAVFERMSLRHYKKVHEDPCICEMSPSPFMFCFAQLYTFCMHNV